MKMIFNELEGFDDFRGRVDVIGETPAEVLAMIKRFRLVDAAGESEVDRALKLVEIVSAGELTHSLQSDKLPWFEINGTVENEFVAPYLEKLKRITGCELSVLPDMELTDVFPDRLKHTYLLNRLWIEFGSVCYQCFGNAEKWNGKSAAVNAENYVTRYMAEEFAHEPLTPEFIANRNGTYSRNPEYATGRKQKLVPQVTADWFMSALFAWWEAEKATPEQKAIIAGNLLGGKYSPWWNDYQGVYVADDAGPIDWDGNGAKARHVKWEEFAALGAAV